MANDLNQCQFIGRLTKTPDLVPADGEKKARARFSIACNSFYNGKENVEYIPIVCFGIVAENVGQYLDTGSQCFVSGKYQTRKWEKEDGTGYNYMTEVLAFNIQFLAKPGNGNQNAGNGGYSNGNQNSGQYNQNQNNGGNGANGASNPDDDLPF